MLCHERCAAVGFSLSRQCAVRTAILGSASVVASLREVSTGHPQPPHEAAPFRRSGEGKDFLLLCLRFNDTFC